MEIDPAAPPLFLERVSYRRKRLRDAARILPIAVFFLVMVPVWVWPDAVSGGGGARWLFGLWFGIILAIIVLHLALNRAGPTDQERGTDGL